MRPRVFIPNLPTRFDPVADCRVASVDISDALRFGELDYFNHIGMQPSPNVLETMILNIRTKVKGFYKPDDFILAIGDPILIAAAIHYALEESRVVNVLRWSRADRAYRCLPITM